jgi:hypothetical protein
MTQRYEMDDTSAGIHYCSRTKVQLPKSYQYHEDQQIA